MGLLKSDASRHTSLVFQWLRLFASSAGGTSLIPGRGTKILPAQGKKKKQKNPAQNEFMVGTQEIWVDWLNDNSLSQCLNWGALGYDGVTKKLPDLNGLTQQRFSFGSNGPVKLGRYSPSCSCILSNHPSLLKCVL